jgi:hypothetical protein
MNASLPRFVVLVLPLCMLGCGGGGGGSGGGGGGGLYAPDVARQTLIEPVEPPAVASAASLAAIGASDPVFAATGRGLLFTDGTATVAFDAGGVLRRAFVLPDTVVAQTAATTAGVLYLTTFDFADPLGDRLVRYDAEAAQQSTWSLPGPSSVLNDGGGRAYFLPAAFALGSRTSAQAGLAFDSISRLAGDGALAWTVDALPLISLLDQQARGFLVTLQPDLPPFGAPSGTVLAHVGSDGEVPWQIRIDAGASGATLGDIWGTGDGGALAEWSLTADLLAGAGIDRGLCRVTPGGDFIGWSTMALSESLVLAPAWTQEQSRPANTRLALLATGADGALHHLRVDGTELHAIEHRFEGENATNIQPAFEPASGELLALVDTDVGRHLVRWRRDGSLRWAVELGGFSGVGRWHGLESGGALVVTGPPTLVAQGGVSCVVSIGADGAVQWVRDAFELSYLDSHEHVRLKDDGACLWWGSRLFLVGASGEFRAELSLSSPTDEIVDAVPAASGGMVLAVRSPAQPGIAFWTVGANGAPGATCLMEPTTPPMPGIVVPPSSVSVAPMQTLAATDLPFSASDAAEFGNPPAEFEPQLEPAAPLEGADLLTADPCALPR